MSGATITINGMTAALTKATPRYMLRRVPEIVGTLVVAGVKGNFVASRDPETNGTWKPIRNRVGQPLRDKRRLMRSIHPETVGRGVAIGTNLIYAATHQFGDPNRVPVNAKMLRFKVMGQTVFARKVSIPQRRFLPETDTGLKNTAPTIAAEVAAYMNSLWESYE